MAEYRIDELARLADTTVRNVRVYQDRGLLAPPRKQGRVGIYSEAHLARLRLIGQLLRRGYTFATIGEMFQVWERGGNLADIIGFESAIGDSWSDEVADYVTLGELRELFGTGVTPRTVRRSMELGILERDGLRFRVPSPRLLHAGAELVRLGMSVDSVLDIAANLREKIGQVSEHMVRTVFDHIVAEYVPGTVVRGGNPAEIAELTRRVRPLAQQAVDAVLAQEMAENLTNFLGEHFAEAMEDLERERAAGTPGPSARS
ncbi:MerR family transcriptional regulator [Nocardiopsis algeriensis]|uniref:DNA-binding transcriptional MerR regulator n=1 Tax=Nocardiopsis algeriensis TaxID=1478215 RepID=A0A841IPF7_9ACTN|nr:MerR family transcriptional regulator [Nocardiopsis algeriensis]MBB6120719.1 DNA-binding transcriptional MerR regulator [Nocardiopsis algeriensis]